MQEIIKNAFRLENWFLSVVQAAELNDWYAHGDVYGNPRFPEGRRIHTSPVCRIRDVGDALEVETANSVYRCPLGSCDDRFFSFLTEPSGRALFQGSAEESGWEELRERIKARQRDWLTRDDPELTALLPEGDCLVIRFGAGQLCGFRSLTVRQNGHFFHYRGIPHLGMTQDSFLIGTEQRHDPEWHGPGIDFRYFPDDSSRLTRCEFYRTMGWDGPVYGIWNGPQPLTVASAPYRTVPSGAVSLPGDGKPHLLWEKIPVE